MAIDHRMRNRIVDALCATLKPLPDVLAGWEGGSAAFDALDDYSDIDLNFLVTADAQLDTLYLSAEESLANVSPIILRHASPPGCYYKLKDTSEFLLVDLCFFRAGAPEQNLEVERHGNGRQLFDKGGWLRPQSVDDIYLASKRQKRLMELQSWFSASQSFVRKAILRGQHAEALASFWGYTLRPLVEILRLRYCPIRWDFGMRYLDRDLPPAVYGQICELMFVRSLEDLECKLLEGSEWGRSLLKELDTPSEQLMLQRAANSE